jgi:hypothetical protein
MLIVAALVWPRPAEPHEVPLPRPDSRALEQVKAEEHARIARLGGSVSSPQLAVGTALRAFLRLEATKSTVSQGDAARRALDFAVSEAYKSEGAQGLLTLRAVQVARFLDAVERFEASGQVNEDLRDLGGNFIDRMRDVGWIDGRQVLLSDDARRAAYKIMWNQTVGVDKLPEFALTLDENRALYAFYISHPVSETRRTDSFAARRKEAKTAKQCADLAMAENAAREAWRMDKIRKIGAIDPAYPVELALGVSQYRAHKYPASVESFRTFQRSHENGQYAAIAQGYMRAAIREAELEE